MKHSVCCLYEDLDRDAEKFLYYYLSYTGWVPWLRLDDYVLQDALELLLEKKPDYPPTFWEETYFSLKSWYEELTYEHNCDDLYILLKDAEMG